jgi:hypothetical protein
MSRPSGVRMTTGLPPGVTAGDPDVTGRPVMSLPAAPPTERKFSGSLEIL